MSALALKRRRGIDEPRHERERESRGPALRPHEDEALELQRTIGNRATTALIQRQEEAGSAGVSLASPRGGAARPSLLGGEGLSLDPAIEADMGAIALRRQLEELLDPDAIRRAIRGAPLDLRLPSGAGAGEERPPWLPRPGERPPEERPLVPRGAGPAEPREGSAGDVMEAVMAVPAVEGALDRLKTQAADRARRDWGRLGGGERALVIGAGATIAGTALAGALANPDSRNFLLDQLNGRELPVPGVGGLSVTFSTQRDNLGVMFNLDVGRYLPESLGFR